MSTIMVIGAHPDDIEIGFGATIHKSVREGHEVVAVDLTDGEPTPYGTKEIRAKETARANEILGITNRRCLDLPNRTLADTEEARCRLGTVMRETRPDIVVTHLERDVHPDHVAAFAITRGAVLMSRIVKIDLEHEPWRPGPVYSFLCSHLKQVMEPSFLLAVEKEDFEAKVEAILAYDSQFGRSRGLDWMRTHITTRLQLFGALIGQPYAEAVFSEAAIGLTNIFDLVGEGRSNAVK